MPMPDIRIAADTFAALVVMEALVKPTAIFLGRWLIARADRVAPIIPDWLYRGEQ